MNKTSKLKKHILTLIKEEWSKAKVAKQYASGYIGSDFSKVASDEDIEEMIQIKDEYAQIYNQELRNLKKQINQLRKKYNLKPEPE